MSDDAIGSNRRLDDPFLGGVPADDDLVVDPGAVAVHVYVSDDENALYVRDEFVDADAMGFHLGTTAAAHFPDLLAIATPGPFFFLGDVPAELQAATQQMGLGAEFSLHAAGYDR